MASFGEELRRERELREIALREVSEATKINIRHLEAMERNDFSHLPGGLYNRGIVRAYCEFVGIDAEAMVNAYLLEVRGQNGGGAAEEPPGVLRGDRRDRQAGAGTGRPGGHARLVRWGLAAVVLAAAVALLLWLILGVAPAGERAGDTAPFPAGAERGA